MNRNSYKNKNMVIIDKGRDVDERSAILIENGIFKGLGFFNLNYQINNISVLESFITPMENNRDTQHIIQSYLRKNSKLKVINL
jgi:DNA polymerase-3 subunit epsilon